MPALRLSENGVQDHSADSLAPPLGNDEDQVEEATAGNDSTRTVITTQRLGGRHADHPRALVRQEEPRRGLA